MLPQDAAQAVLVIAWREGDEAWTRNNELRSVVAAADHCARGLHWHHVNWGPWDGSWDHLETHARTATPIRVDRPLTEQVLDGKGSD